MRRYLASCLAICGFFAPLHTQMILAETVNVGVAFQESSTLHPPQRIVSTSPGITEIVFALGQGDQLVGVTTFCVYPPEALTKPKIGGFASPSLEAIMRQRPDLVILVEGRTKLEQPLNALNIPTLITRSRGLDVIYETIQAVAHELKIPAQGQLLVSHIKEELQEFGNSISRSTRPRVLLLVGRTPGALTDLHSVGGESYIGELIELAGGLNVLSDSPVPYPRISLEEVLSRDPEIIVDMTHGDAPTQAEVQAIQKLWARFPSIDAVERERVYIVTQKLFVVPGPRVVEAVRALYDLIHFGERP